VNSTDLRPEQVALLKKQIDTQLRYLTRLRDRMTRVGFRGDDRLFVAVLRAYNGLHDVNVELHYLSVPSGVAR
jgi:hypothetical protein